MAQETSTDNIQEFVDSTSEYTVPDQLSFEGEAIPTDTIIGQFIIEEDIVSRYEEARRWETLVGKKPAGLIFLSYFSAIIVSFINSTYSVGTSTLWALGIILIGIPVLAAVVLMGLNKVFKNRAEKEMLDHHEAVYHRFALAIRAFRSNKSNNLNDVRSELESAEFLMEYDSKKEIFDPEFTEELEDYLDDINDDCPDNWVEDTFPIVADRILRRLLLIRNGRLEGFQSESEIEIVSENIGPRAMIKSYLGDWVSHRYVRMVGPYIIAAPILYGVYQVNIAAAQILAVLLVGVVQTYYSKSSEK